MTIMHQRSGVLLALLLICHLCAGAAGRAIEEDADLVQVDLYGESLCPYCARFTVQQVAPLLDLGLGSIFNFSYTAYGNAINSSQGLLCQHGPLECRLNRVINCAQQLNPEQQQWLPFVVCLEGRRDDGEQAVMKCAKQTGLDEDAISKCAHGDQGLELEAQAKERTDSLQPAHTYVPWVVVNGVPLGADYAALQSIICVAYTGKRPEACKAVPPTRLSEDLGTTPLGTWISQPQHAVA